MNLSWFVFSISAVVLFGVSTAFYKLPTLRGQNKPATTFWVLLFSELFSLIFFWKHLSVLSPHAFFLAALWGVSFALITMLQIYALEHVDTNTLFPITTTLSLVTSVLLGIVLFNDALSFLQYGGIVLAIIAIYLFLYKKGKIQHSRLILWIGTAIVFLSVFNKIIQKFAADVVEIHSYQIWQYVFGALFALLVVLILNKEKWKDAVFSGSFNSGLVISIPAFFGGWAILVALTKGPFSLITALHSMYIFVSALVGYLVFKEKLTTKKVFLILLALVAILIIRLG